MKPPRTSGPSARKSPPRPGARPPAPKQGATDAASRPATPRKGASDKPAPRPPASKKGTPDKPASRPHAPKKRAPDPAPRQPAHSKSADEPQRAEQRIAKLLARAGIASRREIERMIAEGRIAINGEPVTTPATLLTSLNGVTVDGAPVAETETTRLFLFHKPSGCLTAERDFSGRKTIYDLLPKDLPRLMPIGRLDMTTEGLLLLTNDGGFKRQMELPSTGIERTYRARAFGTVSQTQLEALIEGVEIDGMRYGRIDANLERSTGRNQWIEMTLTEGKNREVRRVLEHLGLTVNRLIRTRYGPWELEDSPPGALVEIKPHDLERFLRGLPKRK